MKTRITLNQAKIEKKVTNKKFGKFVANEWRRLINPYTPKDTGALIDTTKIRPFEIEYVERYSHYVYEGILYVDPATNSSYAPFGVTKVPTEQTLEYQKNNPYSTDHWDIKAAQAGQKDKLYRTINSGLKTGRF